MPMIDLDLKDTFVYSTMYFVVEQAKYHSTVPVLTLDKPLWFRAYMANVNLSSEISFKSVVLSLVGLNGRNEICGSIGHIMTGSSLSEIIETICCDNTATHGSYKQSDFTFTAGSYIELHCLKWRASVRSLPM